MEENEDSALQEEEESVDPLDTSEASQLVIVKAFSLPGKDIVGSSTGLHGPSEREFVCPYCSNCFAYKHVLERHVKQIHEKHLLIPLQCPKCAYTTSRKEQMQAHFSVVHEDYKPFNCSECNFRAPKAFRVTVSYFSTHKVQK